ncbi:MAG: ribosome-binding factor [Rickettsiaceae bacterium]|jgi:ribosome-binding factor A|nr:ribosome-binding factor [Rickettsiaceae bacterium]
MNKNHTKNNQKSQRQLQIGEQIKRVLAEMFLQDDVLSIKNYHITILQADVSPDAKNAKIFIDVFGEIEHKKILEELKKITPYLRGKLANKINLRYTPELAFVIDDTSKNVSKIEDLLNKEAKRFEEKK